MIVEGKKILTLIPQKPPMVMIDKLIYCDEKVTRTGLFIKESNIFCENGVFSEPGIIENIAQTAAIQVGYLYKEDYSEIPVGYIGAIKNLKIYFLPKVNTEIITEITIEREIFDFTLISGKVKCFGKIAAECEMKIYLKKE